MYDELTLDELAEFADSLFTPIECRDWYIARRAVRDAFLDLVDEFEDEKIVLVASDFLIDLARTARERGFQEGRASVGIHGFPPIRDADHG